MKRIIILNEDAQTRRVRALRGQLSKLDPKSKEYAEISKKIAGIDPSGQAEDRVVVGEINRDLKKYDDGDPDSYSHKRIENEIRGRSYLAKGSKEAGQAAEMDGSAQSGKHRRENSGIRNKYAGYGDTVGSRLDKNVYDHNSDVRRKVIPSREEQSKATVDRLHRRANMIKSHDNAANNIITHANNHLSGTEKEDALDYGNFIRNNMGMASVRKKYAAKMAERKATTAARLNTPAERLAQQAGRKYIPNNTQ